MIMAYNEDFSTFFTGDDYDGDEEMGDEFDDE